MAMAEGRPPTTIVWLVLPVVTSTDVTVPSCPATQATRPPVVRATASASWCTSHRADTVIVDRSTPTKDEPTDTHATPRPAPAPLATAIAVGPTPTATAGPTTLFVMSRALTVPSPKSATTAVLLARSMPIATGPGPTPRARPADIDDRSTIVTVPSPASATTAVRPCEPPMATASGWCPTWMGRAACNVWRLTGVTVSSSRLATTAQVPSGLTATASGSNPVATLATCESEPVSMTERVLAP